MVLWNTEPQQIPALRTMKLFIIVSFIASLLSAIIISANAYHVAFKTRMTTGLRVRFLLFELGEMILCAALFLACPLLVSYLGGKYGMPTPAQFALYTVFMAIAGYIVYRLGNMLELSVIKTNSQFL
jgi:hypothetical protein